MPPLQRHSSDSSDGGIVAAQQQPHRPISMGGPSSFTAACRTPSGSALPPMRGIQQRQSSIPTSLSTSPFDASNAKEFLVTGRRDVIVGTHPLYNNSSDREGPPPQQQHHRRHPLDFLDRFINLCVCEDAVTSRCGSITMTTGSVVRASSSASSSYSSHTKAKEGPKKRIVYPIAKYPGRLNSPFLVHQRRKSLEKFLTFRPVPEESTSLAMKNNNTKTHE
jgi:hypothetical protein